MIPGQANIIPERMITAIRTDYLKAITKIHLKAEKETERIRKKYNLTEDQFNNIVNTL